MQPPMDLDINRMMIPNDQGSGPTLPRCTQEHSLCDCWPPDQFDRQLIGSDSLIFLGQTRLQPEIEFAPTNSLCKEIRYAFLIVRALAGVDCRQTLRESISKAYLLPKTRQLIGAHLDRDLNARFPTPFFHVEHTGQHVGMSLNRVRPEEERDAKR